MNLDITKLSIDELKTFKKFNREFLPKIKKLDFDFADMKKGELMLISTPKDIIKFIKKTPSTKKYNFKDIRLKLAKKSKADNTCPVTFGSDENEKEEPSPKSIKYLNTVEWSRFGNFSKSQWSGTNWFSR